MTDRRAPSQSEDLSLADNFSFERKKDRRTDNTRARSGVEMGSGVEMDIDNWGRLFELKYSHHY